MKRSHLMALLAAVAISFGAATAEAGDLGIQSGLPYFGYGYSGSLYGLGRIPVPPYYALHPPVYYSHPIARPYGQSPYAWRPSDAAIQVSKPQLTVNPFFKPTPKSESAETDAQTASVIVNPYVRTTKLAGR